VTRRTTLGQTRPGAVIRPGRSAAANHAMDRPAIAETLGVSKITGSIIPATGLIAGHAYSAPGKT